jgi:hypothetical protein
MAPADSTRILVAALVLLVLAVAALWVVPLVRRRSLDAAGGAAAFTVRADPRGAGRRGDPHGGPRRGDRRGD